MKTTFRRPKKPDTALPSLNAAVDALDLARDKATLKITRDAFSSASALIAAIRVCFFLARVCRFWADIRRTR